MSFSMEKYGITECRGKLILFHTIIHMNVLKRKKY